MGASELSAEQFDAARMHLRAVAYRMLGSHADADDAVQEAWLRFDRTDTGCIQNLDGWLTRVVARVCLNMLRARRARHEVSFDVVVPDPVVGPTDASSPEHEALVADGVGLAMLVILDTLAPAERLAVVLHDMFAVPFAEIAPMVRRSPTATRKLASRARRRLEAAPRPDSDLERQREVVDAYFAAARDGDLAALVAVLDPDVVMRSDGGEARPRASVVARGSRAVAGHARDFMRMARFVQPVLVNGVAGALVAPAGRRYAVMAFVVTGGKVVAIDVLADPARLRRLDLDELLPHSRLRTQSSDLNHFDGVERGKAGILGDY